MDQNSKVVGHGQALLRFTGQERGLLTGVESHTRPVKFRASTTDLKPRPSKDVSRRMQPEIAGAGNTRTGKGPSFQGNRTGAVAYMAVMKVMSRTVAPSVPINSQLSCTAPVSSDTV
ncbi:hypothetical protein AQS8620_03099 [Aquimixticola soesokkakensis]|uniref:Uncharacterized protein n=1 Tax=Aquimixticola soesokkakensis TaxID=1519096 RepID=A0A1Y5TLN1_9RHOB|nr:hypothetical protein AQS8620_03099 [Aquimixticola soesokkakensis]